jgi:hypothetical protein
MTKEDFLRVQAEARKTMEQLQKLYPSCFDKDGKPIVATLTFPKLVK